jgi:hypothetical protein
MGIGIRHAILFLMVISSLCISLPHAKCCGGACVVGGGSSYDFMGDPAVNMDMSRPDEFIRDNLGNGQTTLSVKSLTQEPLSNNNSSLNQTNKGNISQNSSAISRVIDSPINTTSDNTTVKLGASGMQDKRLSTLAFTIFNGNMF